MKITVSIVALFICLTLASTQEEGPSTPAKTGESGIRKEDTFRKTGKSKTNQAETLHELGILIEYISVEHATANDLLQKFGDQPSDVTNLRGRLEEMLDEGDAELVETTWLRTRSGNRAETESIREYIYPSGFEPAQIPSFLGNSEVAPLSDSKYDKLHFTSATPSRFECRNAGTSFEVDAIISANQEVISLNLTPEIVTRLEDRHYLRKGFEETARGTEHIFSPTFHTIKDMTQVDVAPGKFNLLGVHTPHDDSARRILTILRADLIPIH
ncbi:MAG: hypothetical protein AAGC68_13815 [Verrucomicrobiota bacterium]